MTAAVDAPTLTRLDIEVCRDLARRVETRAALNENGMPTMVGHFSVFNVWYEIDSWFEGRFLERVAPGAFKKTFREQGGRIRVLLEHGFDPSVGDKPLGAPTVLREDEIGAYYEVPLFDTSYNRDLVPALEAGVYGASFRFRVIKDEWVHEPGVSEHNPEGLPERTLKELRVAEFGPTVFPASPTATSGLRCATDRYYEQLRTRFPDSYEAAVRALNRTVIPLAPAPTSTPAANSTGAAPEPQPAPGEAAATQPDEPRTSHSDDPHETVPPEPVAPPTPRSAAVASTMSVEERQARQEEIRSRLQAIDDEYNGAALPEDVQQEWDALKAEYDEHTEAIKAALARRADLEARAAQQVQETRGVEPHRPSGPAFVPHRSDAEIYDLDAIRRSARSMDDLVSLMRANAMRAIERARYGVIRGVTREKAQAHVATLLDTVDDDHGTLARRILVTGSPVYERAFSKAMRHRNVLGLAPDEARALSLGVEEEGGYAVPFQLDPTVILTSEGSVNPLRQVARVEQIVGKTWQGVTSEGIVVTRSPEKAEATDNAPQLDQPEITPTRVLGWVPFTIELEQDWGRLRAEITRLLNDAKDQEEASSFALGDGTPPNPAGLVSTAPPESLVASTATGTITVPDDLHKIELALGPRFRANASWLANKGIYQLIRTAAIDSGITAEEIWARIGPGMPAELIGYPARELSTMDGTIEPSGGGTSRVLAFGDYGTGFMIVDRIGMQLELVPHVFGATNRFPTGQRGIVALWRNTSKIIVPQAIRILTVTSPA